MTTSCQQCGIAISDSKQVSVSGTYCPKCLVARYRRGLRLRLLKLTIFIVAGFLIVFNSRDQTLGWILLNLALLDVFGFVTTTLHEFGHAFTAISLGMRVHRVVIGAGPTLWQTQLFGLPVIFKIFALGGGHTVATHPTLKLARTKHFLFVLAGPFANLAVAIISIWLLGPAKAQSSFPEGTGLYPFMVFIGSNLLVFIVNLVPQHFAAEHGALASDGRQLLHSFRKRNDFASGVVAHLHMLSTERIAANNYAGARDTALDGLRLCDKPDLSRAYLLNQVAWCDLLLGDAKLLEEATAHATQAWQIAPDNAAIKGTLGSILVEAGHYQRGLTLLLESNQGAERDTDRALNLCHVAIAHQRLGDTNKASEVIGEIEVLDANCILLKRVRELVKESKK